MTTDLRPDKYGFVECDVCRAKPGTPALCASCLANRQVIYALQKEIEQLKQRLNCQGPPIPGIGYSVPDSPSDLPLSDPRFIASLRQVLEEASDDLAARMLKKFLETNMDYAASGVTAANVVPDELV